MRGFMLSRFRLTAILWPASGEQRPGMPSWCVWQDRQSLSMENISMAEKAIKKIPNRKKPGSGPGQLQTAVDGPTPSPMGPWGPNGIRAPRRPNLYQLQGDHLHITYSPAAFDGQPNL